LAIVLIPLFISQKTQQLNSTEGTPVLLKSAAAKTDSTQYELSVLRNRSKVKKKLAFRNVRK